jgi:hypothetical protein
VKATSSKVKLDTEPLRKRDVDGGRKRTALRREGAQDVAAARQRQRLGAGITKGNTKIPSGQVDNKTNRSQLPQRPRPSPLKRNIPSQLGPPMFKSPDKHANVASSSSVTQTGPSPVGPLPSFSRATKHKATTTMPGSLFPRSASLEPDPTPAQSNYGLLRERHRAPVMPSRTPLHSKERPTAITSAARSPEDPNPFFGITNTLARARGVVAITDDAKRFLEDANLSPPSSPSPASASHVRSVAVRKSPVSPCVENKRPSKSSVAKGKEKATEFDFDFDLEAADTSGMLRVRGKEHELREAREEHMRKEQERELDPDTTLIMEEREQDKERIRKLEAEVSWLKRQVRPVHRPCFSINLSLGYYSLKSSFL